MPLMYREMGTWILGLKESTSSGVKTKMRLTPVHIQLIASLPTTSLLQERDSILVQLGTLGAFQQSELISLDVCDWLVNRECDSKGRPYGAMVFLKRQKNDQEGKGKWKRISWGGVLCPVNRIKRYLQSAQVYTLADCLKWQDLAMRTTACNNRELKVTFEHIRLQAKLLDYFLQSNKSNINQSFRSTHSNCV